MNDRVNWPLAIGGGLLIGLLVLGLLGGAWWLWNRAVPPERVPSSVGPYESNGETIYFTGFNADGEQIPFTGGPRWLYMRGEGCAACHGEDGRGGVPVMMLAEIPPDIRYEHLTEKEHEENGEGAEEHPPYTDELIKRAITEGLNPAGERLDRSMPRWRLQEQNLEDLLAFLKTLD